jgi:tetratricopeptide (TPR) repeat protein
VEAVALYETAVSSLHRRDFGQAADQLRRLLAAFPAETELAERARLFLTTCERHLAPLSAEPGSTVERLYAATMALNDGAPDRALRLLDEVPDHDAQADAADYLRAVAETERGSFDRAAAALERAIGGNPANRARARVDPDLAALRRRWEGIAALLETPTHGTTDAARPIRIRR